MLQENVISLIVATVRNVAPDGYGIFNLSVDFMREPPDTVVPDVKVLHSGHRTWVLEVSVTDLKSQPIARALVTMLFER